MAIVAEGRGREGPRVALAVLAAGAVIWGFWRGFTGEGGNLAYLLGYAAGGSLLAALLIWLVLYFAFIKPAGGDQGPKYFMVLFLVSLVAQVAGGVLGGGRQVEDARVMTSEMQTVVDSVAAEKAVDPEPKAGGDPGEMERLTKRFFNQALADRNAYQAEMAALEIETFLDPATVQADKDLSRTRGRLGKAQAAVEKYRKLAGQRLVEMRAAAEASPMSAQSKRSYLQGFDAAQTRSGSANDRIWAIEAGVLKEASGALDVLERARGRWSVEDGQFSFQRADDLKAFQVHTTAIDRLIAEQEGLQQQARARAQAHVTEMQRKVDEAN